MPRTTLLITALVGMAFATAGVGAAQDLPPEPGFGPGPGAGPGPMPGPGYGPPLRALPRHADRPHPGMLPPDVPYRDPRVMRMRPPPRAFAPPPPQPDFVTHAYLPRPTEHPMYNEPPLRFPQQ